MIQQNILSIAKAALNINKRELYGNFLVLNMIFVEHWRKMPH